MEEILPWTVRSFSRPEQNLEDEWKLARQKMRRWAFQQREKTRVLSM